MGEEVLFDRGKDMKYRQKITCFLAYILYPTVIFYLFQFYTYNPFTTMQFKHQLLNIVFYVLVNILLVGMVRRLRVALIIQTTFFMIIGLINYYVQNFRGAPIMPWDIYSIDTASSVANNFSYKLGWNTVSVLIGFLVLLVLESRIKITISKQWYKRVAMIGLPVMALWGYVGMIQNDTFVLEYGLYDKLFTPAVMNKRDGNIVAFIMEMEYLKVEKPDNYSAENSEEMYEESMPAQTQKAVKNPNSETRPNIIVIMNEAFSDVSILGELQTNVDYMPFIHSLQAGADNAITGDLNVSVLGGNTANTEFEFLTGNTLGFLPQGSVAYQQYVQEEMPTLVSYLKDLGYKTVAMHPYGASGWERDRVYPLLGFEKFLSLKSFARAEKIRNYVSDEACYDKIIELYEEKKEGQPLFVFNVTMQNHSGYEEEFENFTADVKVDGISTKSLAMYLSLIKESDKALQNLIAYFEEQEEETLILFFGDHQPATYVTNPILRHNGINPDDFTEEQNLLRYKVPYVIWSNFDIKEKNNVETSVNYLAIDVLKNCGLPLPSYQNVLSKIRKDYPVITGLQVKDAKGNYFTIDECEEELKEYQNLQYYLLFDYMEKE